MIDKNKLFSLFGNTDENKGEILVEANKIYDFVQQK